MASAEDLPVPISALVTPCLLVDRKRVEQNCQKMLEKCKEMGVTLKPMTKTHKCREACELSTGGRKSGITVSTVAEAEFFADGGYDDILLAAIFTADKIPRIQQLAKRLSQFHVVVDCNEGACLLEQCPISDGKKWSVYLMVDSGGEREGVLYDDDELAVPLAKHLSSSSKISFQGLYVCEHNAYDARGPDEIRAVAEEAAERVLGLAQRLREADIPVKSIAAGSTPSACHPGELSKQYTELHPGNYVFFDAMQSCFGSCTVDDIAVKIATRVVGHYPHRNQLLVDAGFTALSCDNKDREGIPNKSICLIQDQPRLTYAKMNQEYGIIESRRGQLDFEKYPIGTMLFLWPWHACATASCHRQYYVHDGDMVTQIWTPCAGW